MSRDPMPYRVGATLIFPGYDGWEQFASEVDDERTTEFEFGGTSHLSHPWKGTVEPHEYPFRLPEEPTRSLSKFTAELHQLTYRHAEFSVQPYPSTLLDSSGEAFGELHDGEPATRVSIETYRTPPKCTLGLLRAATSAFLGHSHGFDDDPLGSSTVDTYQVIETVDDGLSIDEVTR
ncbi:hypothetical protein [Haloarchaeobius iranensis]|uniref:Uncharacterized protein n=1 Tax=Haloarchaeobius iranensis TaxID=996166 RepID=A0A1G9YE78_9EURY|nr:hypothetical protein [Haloarchaeobius iranensis]SDN07337.1 hypothetical protein SAMN05192554_11418 [Haloarchaeobius iranensis]